ncbi:MAG: hypothetical protein H7333_02260 [Bdellovibrionales bacterium]|nr:hypothetical protein [Oligoflexia bacterium]
MKILLSTLSVIFLISATSNAQVNGRTLGAIPSSPQAYGTVPPNVSPLTWSTLAELSRNATQMKYSIMSDATCNGVVAVSQALEQNAQQVQAMYFQSVLSSRMLQEQMNRVDQLGMQLMMMLFSVRAPRTDITMNFYALSKSIGAAKLAIDPALNIPTYPSPAYPPSGPQTPVFENTVKCTLSFSSNSSQYATSGEGYDNSSAKKSVYDSCATRFSSNSMNVSACQFAVDRSNCLNITNEFPLLTSPNSHFYRCTLPYNSNSNSYVVNSSGETASSALMSLWDACRMEQPTMNSLKSASCASGFVNHQYSCSAL